MFAQQCDGFRQVMLLTVIKRQCYVNTYRNLCVSICGGWGRKSVKCENTINFSNLHRYVPRWHIYSQTTRNMLQIRMTYNLLLLCLCMCPQPPSPARSSSPSTDLRVRLCRSLLSTCRLTAKTLIFPIAPSVVLIFCFPCRRKEFPHYAPFSYQLPSLLSLSLTVCAPSLLSLALSMALVTLTKTAIPPQWCGRSDALVHQAVSSSFSSHFSEPSSTEIGHCCYLQSTASTLTHTDAGWASHPRVKRPPCAAGKRSFSLSTPVSPQCYSPV